MIKSGQQNYEINVAQNAFERLDGEFVVISFLTGKYFTINTSGSDLISLITERITSSNWKSILEKHYGDQAFHGIEEFLEKCILEEIVTVNNGFSEDRLIDLPPDCSRELWIPPILNIFEDLSDLLLVDPIHESSTDGWPATKVE
jgi:hypothetical protein